MLIFLSFDNNDMKPMGVPKLFLLYLLPYYNIAHALCTDSERSESPRQAYKFVARWSHSEAEARVASISICHFHISHNAPLPSKILHNLCFSFFLDIIAIPREIENKAYANFGRQIRCIMGNVEVVYKSFGCPQLTSSSCDVRVHIRVARECYFKCECKCCGALSCFIHKSVSRRLFTAKTLLFPKICTLNSCYIEANQQWIGSFPADRCDWLIKSRTGFSSVHTSAVEPESELRPK